MRIEVAEKAVPVREDVHAACEMLGLDPLHVACEGRFIVFVAAKDAERALQIMRGHATGAGVAAIGEVVGEIRAAGHVKKRDWRESDS